MLGLLATTRQARRKNHAAHLRYSPQFWGRMGGQAALDLPLFGPGPGGKAVNYISPGVLSGTLGSGMSWGPGNRGISVRSTGLGAINCGSDNSLNFGSSDFFLLACVANPNYANSSIRSMLIAKDDVGARQFTLEYNGPKDTSLAIRVSYFKSDGTNVSLDSPANPIKDADYHTILGQRVRNSFEIWVDGLRIASGAGVGTHGAMASTTTALEVGGRVYSTATDYLTGNILFAIAGKGHLPAGVASQFPARPWSRFSRRQAVFAGSATGGASYGAVMALSGAAGLSASSIFGAAAGIITSLSTIASSLQAAAAGFSASASEAVQSNLASGSASVQAAALETVLTNLVSASGNVQGTSLEEVLTNLLSVTSNISGNSARVASSIVSLMAEIRAVASESTAIVAQGLAGLSSAATTEVLTNLLALQEYLQSVASLVASSLHSATGQVSGPASAVVMYNLLSVSEFVEALASELASSLEQLQAGSGASAVVEVLANLYNATSHTGATATVAVLGSKLLLFRRRRLDLI